MATELLTKLSPPEKDILRLLYQTTKFAYGIQINFLSARLALSTAETKHAIRALCQEKLIHHEKYGLVVLSEKGKAYLQKHPESVTLISGD